jgi:hypothetical protein
LELKDWQKEGIKIQYDKLTNDWRSFNNLIWAVPTVAVAIMSGMLVASYHGEFNNFPQVRIVILGLGSLFLFALTVEVIKKRFHMNAITFLLKDLEEGLELDPKFRFPLGTAGIDKYIEDKTNGDPKKRPDDYSDPVFKFFKTSYARKYLTYVILIAAISLALLAEWEFIKLGEGDIRFYLAGIVIGLGGVGAAVSNYIYNYFHEKRKPKLSVSAEVAKTNLTPRNEQIVKITVKDAKLKKPVVGARVVYPSKLVKLEQGITDNEGSCTWTVDDTLEIGSYKVVVGIYAKGYEDTSVTKEFEVAEHV